MTSNANDPGPGQTRIAPACESDLPAISALAGRIWRAFYPAILSTAQIEYMLAQMYALDTLRDELRSGIRYERLLVNGELAGFASYGLAALPGTFKLHKLYLHPDCHGRGLGSLLLRHCERAVRDAGASRMVLNVNKHNTRAIAAYQRNGYQTTEAVVVDIGGGFVMDDYVMTKALDADA